MPVRVFIVLLLLCSIAQAADPWTPFRKMFPGPREPVIAEPLPPIQPPDAQEAIERSLIDAELQAAIKRANEAAEKAEEAAKAAATPQEPPRDPKSPTIKPRVRARPLDIRPRTVTSAECAQIGIGIGLIGKDGVKREAVARGHSAADIDSAQKACGF